MTNIPVDKDAISGFFQTIADKLENMSNHAMACYFQITLYPDLDEPFPYVKDEFYPKLVLLLSEKSPSLPREAMEALEMLTEPNDSQNIPILEESILNRMAKIRKGFYKEITFLDIAMCCKWWCSLTEKVGFEIQSSGVTYPP